MRKSLKALIMFYLPCQPFYFLLNFNYIFLLQQYSALLIQYKKKDFGGFKHHRVDEEIKRGRYLVSTH